MYYPAVCPLKEDSWGRVLDHELCHQLRSLGDMTGRRSTNYLFLNKKMKIIKLTNGYETKVSNQDFDMLSHINWYAKKSYKDGRIDVVSTELINGKTRPLVRYLLQPKDGMVVDHINGNTLDNRRENLRVCTQPENMMNRGEYKNNKSGYKGVCWNKLANKWKSQITSSGRVIFLGYFDKKENAALAFNKAAKKLRKEFAKLNIVKTSA